MQVYDLPFLTGKNAAEITAYLNEKAPHYHSFWLNDDGLPVIGVLPKVRWQLTKATNDKSDTLTLCISTDDGKTQLQSVSLQDFIDKLIVYHADKAKNDDKRLPTSAMTKTHGYHHGLMGYISYDVAAHALSDEISMQDTPLAYFGHYDCYLKNTDGVWQLSIMEKSQDNKQKSDEIIATLKAMTNPPPTPIHFLPSLSLDDYRQVFFRTTQYLLAGEAYQINLTQRWQGVSNTPISRHLPTLFKATNAPFAGFVAIDDFSVLSVSPELFFDFCRNGEDIVLTTKPIKGTRPRSADKHIDEANKNALANSEKDLAENVMIVDLLRNDLGRYAKFGAVSVPVRFAVESFSNVHHMVSTVTAVMSDVPSLQVLFDSLPAGSITGCPKKHACELINQLETHPRGAYCGTMGYLNFDETGRFNVLIRTLQSQFNHQSNTHQVYLWAGGGITVLSNADDEYQECLDKINHIKTALENLS